MKVISKARLPFNPSDNRMGAAEDWPIQATPTAVKMLLRRTFYSSFEESYSRDGVDMIARCILSIYSASRPATVQAIDRLYRLIDTTLNGRQWAWDEGGPELPDEVPIPVLGGTDVRAHLQAIRTALENGQGGELDADMLEQLVQIVALLG